MKRQNIFYGWIVVAALWIVYFLNLGIPLYAGSVINANMVLSEGKNADVIGYSASFCGMMRAIASGVGGHYLSRHSAKSALLFGSILTAVISALMAFMPMNDYMRVVVVSMFGISMVTGGVLSAPVVVRKWFDKNKTLPMSFALSAGTVSGSVISLFIDSLIEAAGWRWSWLFGVIGGVAASFLICVFVKEEPSEVGEIPDGHRYYECLGVTEGPAFKGEIEPDDTVSIYKRPQFYIITIAWMLRNAIYMGALSYLLLYIVDLSFSQAQGTDIILSLTTAGLVGRLLPPVLEKRKIPLYLMAACTTGMVALGAALLYFLGGYLFFACAAALIGSGYGSAYILNSLLASEYFGCHQYPQVMGALGTFGGISGALGPFLMMLLIRAVGYGKAFLAFAVLCAISAVAMLSLDTFGKMCPRVEK